MYRIRTKSKELGANEKAFKLAKKGSGHMWGKARRTKDPYKFTWTQLIREERSG